MTDGKEISALMTDRHLSSIGRRANSHAVKCTLLTVDCGRVPLCESKIGALHSYLKVGTSYAGRVHTFIYPTMLPPTYTNKHLNQGATTEPRDHSVQFSNWMKFNIRIPTISMARDDLRISACAFPVQCDVQFFSVC